MFLCPVLVHFSAAHGIEGALHSDGADIDMGNDDDYQTDADNGMPKLGQLRFLHDRHLGRQTGAKYIDEGKGLAKHLKLEREQKRNTR